MLTLHSCATINTRTHTSHNLKSQIYSLFLKCPSNISNTWSCTINLQLAFLPQQVQENERKWSLLRITVLLTHITCMNEHMQLHTLARSYTSNPVQLSVLKRPPLFQTAFLFHRHCECEGNHSGKIIATVVCSTMFMPMAMSGNKKVNKLNKHIKAFMKACSRMSKNIRMLGTHLSTYERG